MGDWPSDGLGMLDRYHLPHDPDTSIFRLIPTAADFR
jgi:hypothetical protein